MFQIKIDITDINNKAPKAEDFLMEVSLYENATTGDLISRVIATDLDRDGEYKNKNLKVIKSLKFRAAQYCCVFHQLPKLSSFGKLFCD